MSAIDMNVTDISENGMHATMNASPYRVPARDGEATELSKLEEQRVIERPGGIADCT